MRGILALGLALVLAMPAVAPAMDDVDIVEIQEALAAQEARVADFEAKAASMNGGDAPQNMVSLRKNATVTIGSVTTTGYYYTRGKIEQYDDTAKKMVKTEDWKVGDLTVNDAEVRISVTANDHFDGSILLNLHSTGAAAADYYTVAKEAWVRWKNIRETGFGITVGRKRAVFGHTGNQEGYLDSMVCGFGGDGLAWFMDNTEWVNSGHYYTSYNGWKFHGATQVTPHWESRDGKLLLELSFMQSIWNDTAARRSGTVANALSTSYKNGVRQDRSRNYGLGTMSGRATYTPIEDLTFTASFINFRSNKTDDWDYDLFPEYAKDNTAFALSFSWRPAFLPKARIWSQWVYGRNVNNTKGAKSNVVNYGASWDFNDRLTVFAQGDYLHARYPNSPGFGEKDPKDTAWATYVGGIYRLPYGVDIEAGWRHDRYKEHYDGRLQSRITADMFYANVIFAF